MGNKYIILFFFWLFAFQSCNPSSLEHEDFMAYCNDENNGLIQKRIFDQVQFSVKYEPIEYKAIRDLSAERSPINKATIEKLKSEYEGLYYFVFKIESLQSDKSPLKLIARNQEDISNLMHYCQSKLSDDFYLELNEKKIPAVLFHFEEEHNLSNFNLMSLAFEIKAADLKEDIVFVFNDPFFKHGMIKFSIPKASIVKLPKLNLS